MAPPQDREEALFALLLAKPATEREPFLAVLAADDPGLRERLARRLTDHDNAETASTFRAGAEAASTPDEAVGQTLGRYKLLEKVGEGGCGVVYVAEQTEPVRRRVALKVIKLGMDTRAVVARFEAERQALAMMDHPNIAKVLDAGSTETGRPFFVMELVRGIRITDYCDQNHLSTRDRLDLFIRVCQAIQHAHQKGIIHRDIKPSNILVTLHDGVAVPKVIDFGIAKATEGRLTDATVYTQLHQFIGTPAYMSPEQAEMSGLDVDTRSDIYSLGVLLYELLTGKTPFDASELMASGLDALRRTIREQEPLRPSTRVATLHGEELTTTAKRRSVETSKLLHQLRGDLDWIVMKCLEKDRTRRYETANGLAADLNRHLQNEPVAARPPSPIYRFQKAVRRNRLAFAAGGLVMLALLLGLGLSLWQYAGKSRAEREQHRLREQAEARAREASEAQAQAARQRDLAQERLYDSYIREARSIRKARQVGYRAETFARLKEALALGTSRTNTDLVRHEAVACLGDWVGLAPVDFRIPGRLTEATLTQDGTLAAAGSWDRRVSLHETRTGRETATFALAGMPLSLTFDRKGVALYVVVLEGELHWGQRPAPMHLEKWTLRGDGAWRQEWSRPKPGAFSFSPTSEGPLLLLTGPQDAYLAAEDPETARELARVTLDSPMSWLPIAQVRHDRRQLALFSRDPASPIDRQLEVWDLESGKRVARVAPRLGPGWGLSYGFGGGTLAATYDNTLMVHETAQFGTMVHMGGAFESTVGAVIGGVADGLLAVPSIQEIGVRLIHLRSGGEVAYLKLPDSPISSHFSSDGSVLLLTHSFGARVVHLKMDQEKRVLEGHQGGVPCVEFSPDGSRLASVGKDRTLRLWDLSANEGSKVLGELPAPGQTLAFTPDGSHLICGYYNTAELSIWSVASGQQVTTLPADTNHAGGTWSSAISPDGRYLGAVGNGVRIWKLTNGLPTNGSAAGTKAPFLSSPVGVSGLGFDRSGRHVFVQDRLVLEGQQEVMGISRLLLESPSTERQIVATNLQNNFAQPLCILPRRGELAYTTRRRELIVLDLESGRPVRRTPTLPEGPRDAWFIANLRASPDETRFALVTTSGLGVEIRDVATGRLLYTLPESSGSIWWVAWAPDSRHLAVTRSNGEIAVWDLAEVDRQMAELGIAP